MSVWIGSRIINKDLEERFYDDQLENPLHMTYIYLNGNILLEENQVIQLKGIVQGIALATPIFRVRFYDTTIWHKKFVVGLLKIPPYMINLQTRLARTLQNEGFPVPTKQSFNPHVTLRQDGQMLYPNWIQSFNIFSISVIEDRKWTDFSFSPLRG